MVTFDAITPNGTATLPWQQPQWRIGMALHTHHFVETYKGLVGFGLDRQTDEDTLVFYLQKFSDDTLMKTLIKRLTDTEMATLFDTLSTYLGGHLSEEEYHELFLKESHE